jgi:S-formylglutathione hydrolase FrmB
VTLRNPFAHLSSIRVTPKRPLPHVSSRAEGRWFVSARSRGICFFFFLSCLYSLYLSSALAAGRVECNSVPSKILPRPVPYCILLPPSFDADKTRRFPILYFLHGLGDNEQTFLHTGGWNLVEDLREKGRLNDFLIATPAGEATFYINSRDGKLRYEDFLLQEFLPFIERHYRVRPGRVNRAISGISMGGYGALHLAFAHPQLFSSVSAHSAALIEKLPIFLSGNGGAPAPGRTRILGGVFGLPPDPAFWERNSPLTLARTASFSGLKIYFDCGSEDDFGFDAGTIALDKVLASRKIPHEFHLYPGRHDWSYFAAHLEASLSLHSALFP